MATPVVMPQMGESIAEGTVVRWLKKVGDKVERDEPLFEISTDKVDAEIPSPMAGVLTEIKVQPGETVAVNSIVATIGQDGESPPSPSPGSATASTVASGRAHAAASAQPQADGTPSRAPPPPPTNGGGSSARTAESRELTRDDLRRQRSSPLVRRIAREHNVDIAELSGSGVGGRVTKGDILEY